MSTQIAFNDDLTGPVIVSNTDPLPVVITDSLGQVDSAHSVSVVPATDAAFALRPQLVSGIRRYSSQAAESSAIIKLGPGVVYGISFYNANGGVRFLQLFDAANAVPADGEIAVVSLPASTNSSVSVDFGVHGIPFTKGLIVCNSTTVRAKTIGAADSTFFIRYL